jgi:hypothetical protein
MFFFHIVEWLCEEAAKELHRLPTKHLLCSLSYSSWVALWGGCLGAGETIRGYIQSISIFLFAHFSWVAQWGGWLRAGEAIGGCLQSIVYVLFHI